jgi:fatty-acyl-CoA synthase
MSVSREQTQVKLDRQALGASKHKPEQTYLVPDCFEQCADEFDQRTFLIYNNENISYSEVNRQANRYADVAKRLGLNTGDVAAVMIENRPEFFYAWLGLAKIGVIAALINTQAKGRALSHALDATNSQLLFLGAECASLFATVGRENSVKTLLIADGENDVTELQNAERIDSYLHSANEGNPDKSQRDAIVGKDPLFYVFTSGTTGLPKAAIISHARWLNVGTSWNALLDITSDDVFYCILPLFHGAAGMSLASNALAGGASMLIRRKFSASKFWHDVRTYRVTTVQYIGEICRYLVNRPAQENDRDHTLKRMTGAGMTRDVWQQFTDRFGDVEIYEGWGSTEANCGLVNVDQKIGSCGRIPFKEKSNARLVKYDLENECHITDQNGHLIECEAGEVGELIAMILDFPGIAAGRFEGYTSAEATEKKILRNVFQVGDAWFLSGDLFTRDEDDYFYFVDRVGDTYRWKSENVSTTEVAEVLSVYADAETINTYGVLVPDQEGRAGMVAIELKQGATFDPKVFFQLAVTELPHYAVPLFVRVSSQSDMTATFKLRKVDLQKAGYNPVAVGDPLFVLSHQAQAYVPYSEEVLAQLGVEPTPP